MIKKRDLGLFWFILLYATANMVLFHGPALSMAPEIINLSTYRGIVALISFGLLYLFLFFFLFTLLSFLGMTVLKAVAGLLLVGNVIGWYFIANFGVTLDGAMIQNITAVNSREAGGFISDPILFGLGVAAALVALLSRYIVIIPPRWPRRVGILALGTAIFVAYALTVSFSWTNIDALAQRIGGKVLPWSYVFNTLRHYQTTRLKQQAEVLLPDAAFTRDLPAGQKDIVVLIIGESARRRNLAHYGNDHDTTPFTRALGVVAFDGGRSCDTNTIATTRCMFSHQSPKPRAEIEPLPSYTERQGVETILRSNNGGLPPAKISQWIRSDDILADCKADCPITGLDEVLLWKLSERIQAAKSNRVFVILHFSGSHGPAYYSNYPPQFEKFTPVCENSRPYSCAPDALKNAYDNTILYTDSLIAATIDQLRALPDSRSALLYLGDHGESLGENGIFMHATPKEFAGDEQFEVPFLAWVSPAFQAAYGTVLTRQTVPHPDDMIFHSVMGAFGMTSPIYQPDKDIFAH